MDPRARDGNSLIGALCTWATLVLGLAFFLLRRSQARPTVPADRSERGHADIADLRVLRLGLLDGASVS